VIGRGRPPKQGKVHEFRFTLRLWEGEGYDDLIAYLESAPKGKLAAAALRAMTGGVNAAGDPAEIEEQISLDDLLGMADDLLLNDDDDDIL